MAQGIEHCCAADGLLCACTPPWTRVCSVVRASHRVRIEPGCAVSLSRCDGAPFCHHLLQEACVVTRFADLAGRLLHRALAEHPAAVLGALPMGAGHRRRRHGRQPDPLAGRVAAAAAGSGAHSAGEETSARFTSIYILCFWLMPCSEGVTPASVLMAGPFGTLLQARFREVQVSADFAAMTKVHKGHRPVQCQRAGGHVKLANCSCSGQ